MEETTQNKFLVPLAIVVAGGLISGAIYFGGKLPSNAGSNIGNTFNNDDAKIEPVSEKDHIVGSRNAPVVIVEYSDTECPFCKVFHETMQEVVRNYDGKVAWVYRHFPISTLHSRAPKEAESTECAAELGGNQAFWKFINKLFETTNSNDSLDPSKLPEIAAAVGLDQNAFNSCLSSGKYTEFVKKSVENAVKAGARGTPYSIIIAKTGEKLVINGAEPLNTVKLKIDSLLK